MEARQLITAAAQPTGSPLVARGCGGLNLPLGGVLSMPDGSLITLTAAAAFKPVCTPVTSPAIMANGGTGAVAAADTTASGTMPSDDGPTSSDFRDPFYASTFPQCYAIAATTVVAYTLCIMLFITTRSFLDGGVVVLGRRGFTNRGTGPTIGGRPWLQKVAALSVAISLTIASAATFKAAEEQYSFGVQNAKQLQSVVLGGNELKIIRIISQTFLWLAQAQTLIRLFPRQREKVIIKWTAFALITLDVIFQSLNSFQYTYQGVTRPGSFQDAVPALSYLFALSLGVLYAAWVIYYSLMKKRYAYWHPQMKNICLVAILSLLAILVPIVFFILDISKPDFTGWGEYVRWVGAAAASVIVWEWVERIEALEREEKKDGILGREVFDGDEMLDMTPSDRGLRKRRKASDGGDKEASIERVREESPAAGRSSRWPTVSSLTARYRSRSGARRAVAKPADPANTESSNHDRIRFLQPPLWPARPPAAASPVSRTDTPSAASTVYAVRYHPLTETTSRTTPPPPVQQNSVAISRSNSSASTSRTSDDRGPLDGGSQQQHTQSPPAATSTPTPAPPTSSSSPPPSSSTTRRWQALTQRLPPLRSTSNTSTPPYPHDEERAIPTSPPATTTTTITSSSSNTPHTTTTTSPSSGGSSSNGSSKWDIRGRLEEFAATQAERLRERLRAASGAPDTASLPVTVIPAPPRRGAALAQVLLEGVREEEEGGSVGRGSSGDSQSGFVLGRRIEGGQDLGRAQGLGRSDSGGSRDRDWTGGGHGASAGGSAGRTVKLPTHPGLVGGGSDGGASRAQSSPRPPRLRLPSGRVAPGSPASVAGSNGTVTGHGSTRGTPVSRSRGSEETRPAPSSSDGSGRSVQTVPAPASPPSSTPDAVSVQGQGHARIPPS